MSSPVIRYASENPTDYLGIDQVARREFGTPLRFTLNGVHGEVSAVIAQQILDDRHRRRQVWAASQQGRESAPPVDAFTVGFFWAPTTGGVGFATGTWDFRDNYVNGSAPDNIGTIGVQLNDCLQIGRTTITARYYDGRPAGPNVAYVRDAGLNGSPVVGVRDQTSAFQQNADNGAVTTTVEKKKGCGPTSTRGQFIYEHNQDGGSILNISVGFGLLSISYSGGTTSLQKSAGPVGFTIP
jgi:hypothetical protein